MDICHKLGVWQISVIPWISTGGWQISGGLRIFGRWWISVGQPSVDGGTYFQNLNPDPIWRKSLINDGEGTYDKIFGLFIFFSFFFTFFRQVSWFDWVPKIYNELHYKKLLGILLDDLVSQKCEPVSQNCDQVSWEWMNRFPERRTQFSENDPVSEKMRRPFFKKPGHIFGKPGHLIPDTLLS